MLWQASQEVPKQQLPSKMHLKKRSRLTMVTSLILEVVQVLEELMRLKIRLAEAHRLLK